MTRKLQKIMAGLSAVIMLFCMTGGFPAVQNPAVTVRAEDEIPQTDWIITRTGTWGDNLTWTLVYDMNDINNISGVLTISGEGEMSGEPEYLEYGINNFEHQVGSITTKVILESGITSIDENAFVGFSQLKEIEIPNTVKTIGKNAFGAKQDALGQEMASNYCASLTSITIPDSVTSIGENAFHYSALETITLPKKLKSISSGMFKNCNRLKEITIPDSVTSIGDSAFEGCTSLQPFALPTSLKSIGNRAFYKFQTLESIVIPDGVTSIGDFAFYSCTELAEVTIPESVTTFGRNAFWGTKWANTIRVTSPLIINDVFLGFKYNSYFPYVIPDGVTALAGGSLDANTKTHQGNYEWNVGKSSQWFVIPESVAKIDDYTFWSELTESANKAVTLYGMPGSYVETWAEEHEVAFKDIQTLDELYKTLDGDVNGDGEVTVSDAVLLQKWLLGKADTPLVNWKNADLHEDYQLNIYDLCLLKRMLLSEKK